MVERGQGLDLGQCLVERGLAAAGPGTLAGPAVGVSVDDPGASFGCRATAAWTFSYAAAVSAAQREPFTSQPTWTTVVTPTEAAFARPSSTVPDCMSRWVCESATATRRGSGSGGGASLEALEADEVLMRPIL